MHKYKSKSAQILTITNFFKIGVNSNYNKSQREKTPSPFY